eukprot:13486065-Heterocapsa_arctica.AAC.1
MYFNEKQRFQLACVIADDGSGNYRRSVTQIYAIRCTSGHSIPVDQAVLSTPLLVEQANEIPAITHATKTYNLASIFRYGLIPGGGLALGRGKKKQRNASNFN